MAPQHSFAFVFPMASGHINPSLGVARALVEGGHAVHYLCRQQMQFAIEDTGARFHSDLDVQPELYQGRQPSMYGAIGSLQEEHGRDGEGYIQGRLLFKEIMAELMLPGTLRWLRGIGATAVVCDPLASLEAALAASVARIPCVSIMTLGGPGNAVPALSNLLASAGVTAEEMLEQRRQFAPLRECLQRLEGQHGFGLTVEDGLKPLGLLPAIALSQLTLVTTAEFLADTVPSDLQESYDKAGACFAYLGPLLDKPGAKRAAGLRFDPALNEDAARSTSPTRDPVELLREARQRGRTVVLASLGTMITGDNEGLDWMARPTVDGVSRGLTGKELCQAAWGAVFDAFGSEAEEPDALILVALGPQPDALDGLPAPRNAICCPVLAQVDVLRAGVDVFLTHGGQNSFMESLSTGVPVVVCPGFGDQPENGAKAQELGVGLMVDRPLGPAETSREQAAAYRRQTSECLKTVLGEPTFKAKALECSEQLRAAGGVPRATELILQLADEWIAGEPQKGAEWTSYASYADELLARRAAAGA